MSRALGLLLGLPGWGRRNVSYQPGPEQTLVSPNSSFTIGLDTLIESGANANTNYNALGTLYAGFNAGTSRVDRSLIGELDLSDIPANAIITSASINLRITADGTTGALTLAAYRVIQPWVLAQATWNIYSTGNNWGEAGAFGVADCEQTPLGSVQLSASQTLNQYVSIPLAVTKKSDLSLGNGWLIKMTAENVGYYGFDAFSGAGYMTSWPYLSVTYKVLDTVPLRPGVLFTFDLDDGYGASIYTNAFAHMTTKGVAGTAYVVTNQPGGVGDATWDQLREMYADGWAIANHTNTHGLLTVKSQADQETEFSTAANTLIAQSMPRAAYHVAYPGGACNLDTNTAMANTGMISGRTYLDIKQCFDVNAVQKYRIPTIRLNPTVTLATAKTYVDQAKANNTIACFTLHSIVDAGDAASWPIADFQALVDYVVARGVPTYTIDQLYAMRSW